MIYEKGRGKLEGTFQVKPGVRGFSAAVKVKNEKGFKAGDFMKLEVNDPGVGGASSGSGFAELKEDELEKCIDDVPPLEPEKIFVEAKAICDEVQTGTKKDATWTFDIDVPERDGLATYAYVFSTDMSLDEGYG